MKKLLITLIISMCIGLALSGFQSNAAGTEPLRYVAILSQHGANAPTVTVLHNTLGGVPVWTRQGAGLYRAALSGEFPAGRTTVIVPTHQDSLDDSGGGLPANDGDHVFVVSFADSGNLSDDCWHDRHVEITVYPEP